MKKGWLKRCLRDVTTKIGSGATPLGGETAYKSSGISLIRSLNVHDTGFRLKDLAFIGDDQAEQLDNVVVEEGDVLLNITGASIARCCIVPNDILPARVNQHVSILRPIRKQLIPKLLHYMLISKDYKNRLLDAGEGGGSTRQALTKAQLQEFSIEYPESLPEQQRIVGILDEAFAGLATAHANAEKNLQNARALFESHLQSVFTQRGKGWVEKTLGDVCETTQGVQIPKNLHYKSPGENRRRYLYISDFEHDGNLKYVEDIYPKKRVTGKDLIVVNTGATAGKIFRGIDGVLSNNLFKVTLNQGIDGDFLYYFVTSSLFKEHQKKIVKGTANPHMGHENFKSTPANIPPLDVQLETVVKLDELYAETQRLASIYTRILAALEALKKSLLHQAFTGEL